MGHALCTDNTCQVSKPRKYPIFRIPPDTSFPPHFPTGYLDTNFFIGVLLRKLVTPKKNGGNWDEPKCVPFPPFFHKVYSIMVTKFCLMLSWKAAFSMIGVPLDHLEYIFVLVSYVGVCCYCCVLLLNLLLSFVT